MLEKYSHCSILSISVDATFTISSQYITVYKYLQINSVILYRFVTNDRTFNKSCLNHSPPQPQTKPYDDKPQQELIFTIPILVWCTLKWSQCSLQSCQNWWVKGKGVTSIFSEVYTFPNLHTQFWIFIIITIKHTTIHYLILVITEPYMLLLNCYLKCVPL